MVGSFNGIARMMPFLFKAVMFVTIYCEFEMCSILETWISEARHVNYRYAVVGDMAIRFYLFLLKNALSLTLNSPTLCFFSKTRA